MNEKNWSFRYARKGSKRDFIQKEDLQLFEKHIENLNKKKSK